MRVLQVALYDRVGGACIAGYRQHQALRQAGVDSRMWVRFKVTNDPTVTVFQPSLRWRPRLIRLFRRSLYKYQWHRASPSAYMLDPRSEHGADMLAGMPEADVINIQFGWDFLDYPGFLGALPSHIPVVITMHSMETFTGGCAYTDGCTGFWKKCGKCPQLMNAGTNDLTRLGWYRRQSSYVSRDKKKIHFVANSEWLAGEAIKSSLLKEFPLSVIHYGVDTDIFRPTDRAAARLSLGIPLESPVLAFAAASVSNPRKGFSILMDAIHELPKKPFLLTWGASTPPNLVAFRGLHLGNLSQERLCALAYNAADIFVMPSLEEAFGQTGLEAIACGTPVVALPTGGIPEIVRHTKTGILAEPSSALGLKSGIQRLLKEKDLWNQCSLSGIERARRDFSYSNNAKQYQKLYNELMQK